MLSPSPRNAKKANGEAATVTGSGPKCPNTGGTEGQAVNTESAKCEAGNMEHRRPRHSPDKVTGIPAPTSEIGVSPNRSGESNERRPPVGQAGVSKDELPEPVGTNALLWWVLVPS